MRTALCSDQDSSSDPVTCAVCTYAFNRFHACCLRLFDQFINRALTTLFEAKKRSGDRRINADVRIHDIDRMEGGIVGDCEVECMFDRTSCAFAPTSRDQYLVVHVKSSVSEGQTGPIECGNV